MERKKKLLYIHGYNGSPQGHSYSLIRKHLPEGWEIIGMDYCQDNCAVALEQIRSTVESEGIDLVVGSSLGGFLALLAEGVKRFVVNPCYRPSEELPKLGPHNGLPAPSPEMTATYGAFEHRLKEFTDKEKRLISCFMATEDELLGDRYFEEMKQDLGRTPGMIFSGHHLSESAAITLCSLISTVPEMLKDAHKYSSGNRTMMEHSENCGCFSCCTIFPAKETEDCWIDEPSGKQTPVCPYCHMDTLLPDTSPYRISKSFLKKMYRRWF